MASSLGNAIGAVGGYSKWREGRKMQKSAQNAIDNFEWEDLQNPYKDLQVSTMGADLQREELGRATATSVDALRNAGTRGLGVGIGRVMAASNNANRTIAADLDNQKKNIDFAAAGDDANIRNMIEKRQGEELQGYGQMLTTGMNMKYGGISDMMNATMSQGQAISNYQAQNPASAASRPYAEPVSSLVPAGLNMSGLGGGMMGFGI